MEIEIEPSLAIAEADDIRLEDKIIAEKGIAEVSIEFDEDDGVKQWKPQKDEDLLEEKKAREK
ncbi:hypothetical protein ELQ35_06385 [Peribacillus cavernae]|uniref:Uncharacterized protein n=1 Tax=Peribacillus cavernae TaxID=1674310 RepID=A0A433HNS7_9BACI|nr:hypothetical protein [Peribacillus cavernae]MDQ0217587.1 divalent metal cation (Fe/Co/Zn/Cd) transporter [Peribacillus cavernae]RUQ29981.1 hypothetical protein ELQ35_06385 [Peribacillus cavernae]